MNNSINTNTNSRNATTGLVLLLIGSIFLAKNFGILFPGWLFSWPMLLIVIGFLSGLKHDFRRTGAFVTMGIGLFFLLKIYSLLAISFSTLVAVILIGCGLRMVLNNRNRNPINS